MLTNTLALVGKVTSKENRQDMERRTDGERGRRGRGKGPEGVKRNREQKVDRGVGGGRERSEDKGREGKKVKAQRLSTTQWAKSLLVVRMTSFVSHEK